LIASLSKVSAVVVWLSLPEPQPWKRTVLVFAVNVPLLFQLPVFFDRVRHLGARTMGHALLAMTAAMVLSSMAAGRLAERIGARAQTLAGSLVALAGLWWFADFDTNRGQEATPLFIDGVIYVSTAWSKVKAYDARTGKQLWAFDPKVPGEFAGRGCCDVVNRGIAAWNGKIYLGSYDGHLVALDAKDGKVVWRILAVDHNKPVTSTGAPRRRDLDPSRPSARGPGRARPRARCRRW
jgi:outer membrane protein assembly factor BamB